MSARDTTKWPVFTAHLVSRFALSVTVFIDQWNPFFELVGIRTFARYACKLGFALSGRFAGKDFTA